MSTASHDSGKGATQPGTPMRDAASAMPDLNGRQPRHRLPPLEMIAPTPELRATWRAAIGNLPPLVFENSSASVVRYDSTLSVIRSTAELPAVAANRAYELTKRFPCLHAVEGLLPWHLETFKAWIDRASEAQKLAIAAVLSKQSIPGVVGPAFNLDRARSVWDVADFLAFRTL